MVCTRHVVADGQESTLSETEGWVRNGFLVDVMAELVFKDDAGLIRQECFCSLRGAQAPVTAGTLSCLWILGPTSNVSVMVSPCNVPCSCSDIP